MIALALLLFILPALTARAEAPSVPAAIRIATFGSDLTRSGPGLLLRDILSGKDAQVSAVVSAIGATGADILLLTGIDHDHGLVALSALAERISAAGSDYPYLFALRPNRGMATGLDLDGDGRAGGPDDAQGFGHFSGARGMALLSRYPILDAEARDFSKFLWRDLPGARGPDPMRPEVAAIQRLATTGFWEVPVRLPDGQTLRLLGFHAGPPAFGRGRRNLDRNHDETAFWAALLDARLPLAPPEPPFVLLGNANLDPFDGDGRHEAIRALLAHRALQDPAPRSAGGPAASAAQGGLNATHRGDPALDTADHRDTPPGPGNLRVTYVLPSADLTVRAAGVLWPPPADPLLSILEAASRHRPVWIDIAPP